MSVKSSRWSDVHLGLQQWHLFAISVRSVSVVQTRFLPRCSFHCFARTMATMASLSAACGFFAAGLVLCRRRRRGKALSDASGPDISGSAWDRFKLFTCLQMTFRVFFGILWFNSWSEWKNPKMWTVFKVPMPLNHHGNHQAISQLRHLRMIKSWVLRLKTIKGRESRQGFQHVVTVTSRV